MISYRTLNEYMNNIELPMSIEEILDYKHTLEEKDFAFVNSANRFLKEYAKYDSYRDQNAHCIGTCLTNLTRAGIYFLMENEIVTISTSNLKPFSEQSEWQITHYPFREIRELDLQMMEYTNESDYEAGVMYIKMLNEKGLERNHIFRNLNPKHFQCFKDFHMNIIESKKI
ncbi:hypothetical protein [Salinicoccus sp. HZC-1]|uniref:hypothetical protein n=1 Tax=Salinicoccus sp. HZC-1 TaxID=3385497 RepID=UPI00398B564A